MRKIVLWPPSCIILPGSILLVFISSSHGIYGLILKSYTVWLDPHGISHPFYVSQAELLHAQYNASLGSDNCQKDGEKGGTGVEAPGGVGFGVMTLPWKEWNSLNLLADLNRQAERLAWGHEVSEYLLHLSFCASSHTLNYNYYIFPVCQPWVTETHKLHEIHRSSDILCCLKCFMIAKECRQSLHGVQAMSWDFTHEIQRPGRAHFAPYIMGRV